MRHWINLCEDILEGLDEIKSDASKSGMYLSVKEKSDVITLENIQRRDAEKGSGAAIIRRITDYADRVNLPVELFVVKDEGVLIPYYEGLGFSVVDDESGMMEYLPN